MAIDETFVTVILILAILAAIPAGVIVAVYTAKRLSLVTISPVIPWVLVAGAVLLIGAALLFLLPVSYRSGGSSEPAPVTGDFQATPLPRSPGMAEDESCWYAEPAVDSRSVANIPQWTYVQRVEWCGDGFRIVGTPIHRRSWDTLKPFWSFERFFDVTEGEWGHERYLVFSQAKFRFCAVLQALCIDDDDPSLRMTVFGNGTFNVEYKGDWTAGEETVQVLRTSVWEALLMALAGVLAISPLVVGLIAGGFISYAVEVERLSLCRHGYVGRWHHSRGNIRGARAAIRLVCVDTSPHSREKPAPYPHTGATFAQPSYRRRNVTPYFDTGPVSRGMGLGLMALAATPSISPPHYSPI